jgi:dihydrofolate reductase
LKNLILYIACSIDGYIAKTNDDISFLSVVEKEGEDYGYSEFINTIDTVLIGRKTYDKVMTLVPEFLHADKECYVITRTPKENIGNINFYTGDLESLVKELKSREGKNIFIDGGAQLVNELLRLQLIDEMVISYIPVLLGEGISLFQGNLPETKWKLVSVKSFDTGLVQVKYKL